MMTNETPAFRQLALKLVPRRRGQLIDWQYYNRTMWYRYDVEFAPKIKPYRMV